MKVLKKYEILNSEGPIMTLNKHENHWSLEFYGTRVCTIVDPYVMTSFLISDGEITANDKTYVYSNYSIGERMKPEDEKILLKELLEDHLDMWENNEEYFNKYNKTYL